MVRLSMTVFAMVITLTGAAAADDFPPGDAHDLVAASCTQCHDATMVTSQHKSQAQWSDTVQQMISSGAKIAPADIDKVAAYLAKNFGQSAAVAGGAGSRDLNFANYQSVEGKPFQVNPPENSNEVPAFPEQTRAPYHASAPYSVTTLTDKLHQPWGLAFLPDGNILVTEKMPGAMRILNRQGVLSAPLAGVSAASRVPDFALLDVALDPHFKRNHQVFFTFFEIVTPPSGSKPTNSNTYIARARLDEAANALTDLRVIFRAIPAIPTGRLGLKTGGRIVFGPDGNLFVTMGDRDDNGVRPWDVAQRLDTDLGKIIHITPDGAPAPGNPFLGKTGVLPEIWSYGNRSEEGLAFNPATGQLWENEHGPRGGDEVNIIGKGKNYGWPIISYGIDYSGKSLDNSGTQKDGMEQPVYYWDPVIAPSGLAFYRGDLFPQWKNSVFVGGLRAKILTRLSLSGDKVVAEEPLLEDLHAPIRDVRVGLDGAVYVLAEPNKLLKLTPK